MTARAIIKQSELRRMAAIATEQNVTVEFETPEGKVRFMPNIPNTATQTPIDKSKGIRL